MAGMWVLSKLGKRYVNEMGDTTLVSHHIVRALDENKAMSTEELSQEVDGRPIGTILSTLKERKIIEEM